MAEKLVLSFCDRDELNITNEPNESNNLNSEQIINQLNLINNKTEKLSVDISNQLNEYFSNNNESIEYLINSLEDSIKLNYKISDETVEKYNSNQQFFEENKKLVQLIESNSEINQIAKQREILNNLIFDTKIKELELHKFNVMTNSCGRLCSSVASLLGNNEIANNIGTVTNFVCEMSTIYAGYSGFGSLACIGPFGWGLMTTTSIVGLASNLLRKGNNTNPMIGLYKLISNVLESINDLKMLIEQNFDVLFRNLMIAEKNIIHTVTEIKYISYEILDNIKELKNACIFQFNLTNESFKLIDQKLNNIREMILNETASSQIRDVGSFVSKVFYNQDKKLFESNRSELVSRIIEPYESSHITLVGSFGGFEENSLPFLNLNSILSEFDIQTLSNYKINEYLKKYIITTKLYLCFTAT